MGKYLRRYQDIERIVLKGYEDECRNYKKRIDETSNDSKKLYYQYRYNENKQYKKRLEEYLEDNPNIFKF